MKRVFTIWMAATFLWTGSVHAQVTFGLAPYHNSLVQSEEEAKLFSAYLETRIGERFSVLIFKDEATLFEGLRSNKVDLAVVSNLFYREHSGALDPLANFTRSEEITHKLLLIVLDNGPIRSIQDLKRSRATLVLDENSRSRISFLTKTLRGDPAKIFDRISVSPQFVDTLSGLINGSYDSACVEDGLLDTVRRFDPGLVRQVRILQSSGSLASDPVVARKGFPESLRQRTKNVLIEMERDSDGQQILLGLKITKFISPITQMSLYPESVDPNRYRKTVKKRKVDRVVEQKNISDTVKDDAQQPTAVKSDAVPEKSTAEPVSATEQVPDKEKTALLQQTQGQTTGTLTPGEETGKSASLELETVKEKSVLHESVTGPNRSTDKEKQEAFYYRLLSSGALVLFFVLFLIFLILIFRRKGSRESAMDRDETGSELLGGEPIHKTTAQPEDSQHPSRETSETNVETGEFGLPESASLVELRGELKTIRVPDLLQLMSSCSNTGALTIQSKHDEKCLFFREGKICSASCLDKDNKNKLGNVLVKLGKVTEKERAKALAMCAENHNMRLGDALEEIGAIKKGDLKEALQLQAEEIVYSLFLFPEGRFEFNKIEPRQNRDEDLSLDVMNLLMEGARREDEWDKMRQAIPSMEIILGFTEQGKEKLNGAELTQDHELILSLINGERSIRDICVKSTLVDFEVCEFLYRMLQQFVLERVKVA